jgi:hydroxymethylpyrimidine/phosphomethylpyrimidine kinase
MQIALTIAGSDSGGGAGIQADLKTFTRFGVFGTSVITAITAQNTRGVTMWEAVSPKLVRAQMDAVFEDLPPNGIKTGMLGSADVVRSVADGLREYQPRHLVVDPVMVATSGDILLDDDAVALVRDELIPLAQIITPNLDEVRVLLGGDPITTQEGMVQAAEQLVKQLGAKAALVKGGHLIGNSVADVLYDGRETHIFNHTRLETNNTHGTGCTLSAAIAAKLASGISLRDSVRESTCYVHRAITTAPALGAGHGPLNHWA